MPPFQLDVIWKPKSDTHYVALVGALLVSGGFFDFLEDAVVIVQVLVGVLGLGAEDHRQGLHHGLRHEVLDAAG